MLRASGQSQRHENALDLVLIAFQIDIGRHRIDHDVRGLIGGAVTVMGECAAGRRQHFIWSGHICGPWCSPRAFGTAELRGRCPMACVEFLPARQRLGIVRRQALTADAQSIAVSAYGREFSHWHVVQEIDHAPSDMPTTGFAPVVVLVAHCRQAMTTLPGQVSAWLNTRPVARSGSSSSKVMV